MDDELTVRPLQVADAHQIADVLSSPELYEYTGGERPTVPRRSPG